MAERGKVYLVGAGPGDPDLLTLKAVRLMAHADVILHDDLVPPAVLRLAGERALVVSVGKRCGRKKITQAAIHEMMIASARRGLSVIRLKSGDPMIFGRAGEEMDALREAGVPFEVVPGVTAASSAAAFLETSLTDRRFGSRLIVFSGHHAAGGETEHPFSPEILQQDATVALYMPGNRLADLAATLLGGGAAADLPCVLVSDASRPEAAYQAHRLRDLTELPLSGGPRLLLLGRAFESLLSANPPEETVSPRPAVDMEAAIPSE